MCHVSVRPQDDTSGDFAAMLLALTGDRAPPSPTAEEIEATEGEPEIEEIEQENYPVSSVVIRSILRALEFSLAYRVNIKSTGRRNSEASRSF